MADFTLPELGENISAGDVLRVLVKPGDALAKDQPVLELETDKATIEVPSSVAGTVGEIKVKPGDKVKVGQVILTVTEGAGAAQKQGAVSPKQADAKPEPAEAEGLAARSAEASRSSGAPLQGRKEREPSGERPPSQPAAPPTKAEVAPKPAESTPEPAKADASGRQAPADREAAADRPAPGVRPARAE